MTDNQTVRVFSLDAGRSIHWMGSRGTFLATAELTDAAYSFWVDHPLGGGGAASHVHTREEEFFYVVAGEFSYLCQGQTFKAHPGAFVGLPKGLGHRFHNNGSTTGQLLIGLVPGGGEGFFLDLGNPIAEPNDTSTPPDPVRYNEVAARYGQILLPPNLLGQPPDPQTGDLPLGVGRAAILREPGDGDTYAANGVSFTFKALATQTLGAYSVVEVVLAPGASFPAHRHSRYAEGLYVLAGTLTVQSDRTTHQAPTESFVAIPPGARHALTNATNQPVRLLQLTVPGGIEDFVRAACRPVHDRGANLDRGSAPVDLDRMVQLGREFGIEIESNAPQPLTKTLINPT